MTGLWAAATVHLSPSTEVLVAACGVAAGMINGVAGGGTLVAFPVLLALGYPALTANVTTTVGIWPGYVGGAAGFGPEVLDQRTILRWLGPLAGLGAVGGAAVLLTTPPSDFATAAPWLVLAATALFAVQPLAQRFLATRSNERTARGGLVAGTLGASAYGAYFGGGLGVILLALLGLCLPDSVTRTAGLRTVLSVLINGVAAVAFLVAAQVAWVPAGLLALGSLVGGVAGARLVRWLDPRLFRAVVVAIGLATTLSLLVG